MQNNDDVSDIRESGVTPPPAPEASRFFARPTTSAGRWAGLMSLIAFAAVIASTIITNTFERHHPGTVYDVMRVTRLIVIAIFAVSGLAALALALRGLKNGERSIVVWGALVVGTFATTLMIGEFTFLE